jgi:hypothetical protein
VHFCWKDKPLPVLEIKLPMVKEVPAPCLRKGWGYFCFAWKGALTPVDRKGNRLIEYSVVICSRIGHKCSRGKLFESPTTLSPSSPTSRDTSDGGPVLYDDARKRMHFFQRQQSRILYDHHATLLEWCVTQSRCTQAYGACVEDQGLA